MSPIKSLFLRETTTSTSLSPTMTSLLIALMVLIFAGFSLVGALLILRSHRKSKQQKEAQSLPVYNTPSKRASNHRRLTISATPYSPKKEICVCSEKQDTPTQSPRSPTSPVPEIRITFPEEEDDSGKRRSGRVVVVRISENGGVGLEPYHDSGLPPYGKDDAERFQSLDLDRMGGLKEISRDQRQP